MIQASIKCVYSGSQKNMDKFTKDLFSSSGFSNIQIEYTNKSSPRHSMRLRNKGSLTSDSQPKKSNGYSGTLNEFKNKYKLTAVKYSERSILLKTQKTVNDEDKVFNSGELNKPLFYNPSLKGWITSIDNKKYFSMDKIAQVKKNSLRELVEKYDLLIVHDDHQLYDNISSRVLYLQSASNKNPTNKSEYVFKCSELKHGLFFNEDFEVWQTTVANKSILEKYAGTMENSDDEDASYDDSLSEMSSDSEYEQTLSHLTYKNYGRGILVCPKKNDENYGEKYFHGGFWNETLKGWTFSKSKISQLEDLGVTSSA